MYYLSSNKKDFEMIFKNVLEQSQAHSEIETCLSYIQHKNGSPLNCMRHLSTIWMAKATCDLILNGKIELFKLSASIASKLRILSTYKEYINSEHIPYEISGGHISNTGLFYPVMSDDEKVISWLVRNKNKIDQDYFDLDRYNFYGFMRNTVLLALEGNKWDEVSKRSQLILTKNYKEYKKTIPEQEFLISLANKESEGMKLALNKLLNPRHTAKIAARNLLPYIDFYLQPQVLFYGKLASRYGFELGIDDEIAPKELIEYKPLAEYPVPYDFMSEYDWNAPYEFQYEWINKFRQDI